MPTSISEDPSQSDSQGAAAPVAELAKKIKRKKASQEGASLEKPRRAGLVKLSEGLRAPAAKPSEASELYKGFAFERLMISLAWPSRASESSSHWLYRDLRQPDAVDASGEGAPLVAQGREECLELGASAEVVALLEADQELCEAVCKIILGGCKNMIFYGSDESLSENPYRAHQTGAARFAVAGRSSALLAALRRDVESPCGVREAIIELAGPDAAWAGVSDNGVLGSEEEMSKSSPRGGAARVALRKLSSMTEKIKNSPSGLHREAMSSSAWGKRHAVYSRPLREIGEARVLLTEVEGFEIARPVFLAEGLKLAARQPELLSSFEQMCSRRCSFGFETVKPGDGAEQILPELGELRGNFAPRSYAEARALEKEMAKGLAGEGAAGQIALAAAKAYGLEAATPQGLVGEAKRALAERAGLSAAGWKMALNSPMALSTLLLGLKKTSDFVKTAATEEKRKATLKEGALKKEQEKAEQGERLVEARFVAAARAAAESLGVHASSRILSLGMAQNLAVESLERLSRAAFGEAENPHNFKSSFLIDVLAGRLPEAVRRQELDGSEWGAQELRLRVSDIEAVRRQGPTWVKILSDQLDKRVQKELVARGFKELNETGAPGLAPNNRGQAGMMGMPSERQKIERAGLNSLSADLDLLCDYISAMGGGWFSNLPNDFGWGTLMRQQEIWHEDMARQKYENNPQAGRRWEPLLGSVASGEFTAVELVTGMQLIEEGSRMRHCVASYVSACLEGRSRIFSIRHHGARVATLELGPYGGDGHVAWAPEDPKSTARVSEWRVNQNKGQHNAVVSSPETLAFCEFTLQSATAAFGRLKTEVSSKRANGPKGAAL